MNGRVGGGRIESNDVVTSLATFRIVRIPRSMRTFQSRALSSFPSQTPGKIWMGPSMYGTEGEPSPSSSFLCNIDEVLAFGRESTDGLRRAAGKAGASSDCLGGSEVTGLKREVVEDCAEERLSESFFMLRERGLLGGGKMKESVSSEVPEERVEAEARFPVEGTRESSACWAGVSMHSGVTGGFLRWENEAKTD